jgi:hypothetical protein
MALHVRETRSLFVMTGKGIQTQITKYIYDGKGNGKVFPIQAMEALRVVRG